MAFNHEASNSKNPLLRNPTANNGQSAHKKQYARAASVIVDTEIDNTGQEEHDGILRTTATASTAMNDESYKDQRFEQTLLLTTTAVIYNVDDDLVLPASATKIFDPGSQNTYITNECSRKLQLQPTAHNKCKPATFTKQCQDLETDLVKVGIQTQTGQIKEIVAHTIDDILPPVEVIQRHSQATGKIATREILIGIDYFWEFIMPARVYKFTNGHTVVSSTLGELICGKGNSKIIPSNSTTLAVSNQPPELAPLKTIDRKMQNFWDLEVIGVTEQIQEEENEAVNRQFEETVKFENERYVVKWPWIKPHQSLRTNYAMALGRLRSTYR